MLPGQPLQLSHPEFLISIPNANLNPKAQADRNLIPYKSSLVGEGQITYRDFPEKPAGHIPRGAFLHFSDEASLQLTGLSVVPSAGAIQIELKGHPSSIYSTADLSGSVRVSYQMSWLD